MALTPLSSDRLAQLAAVRRQLRDVAGVTEKRPGVFEAARTTVVELLDDNGIVVARLAPTGHASAQLFAVEDAVKRRALIDALRLVVKRLADD
jgi:hypothetical protein